LGTSSNGIKTTIGAAYTGKKIKLAGSKAFRLGIWDTAGSEQFESMTALYYRGAKAAIVCYDITDVSSFEKAKFYVNELRENVPDCRLYLCGTKSDLVSSGKHFRGVPQHEVTEYGQKVNARTVIETSSKTGQNVEELFWRIAKDFLEEITTGKVDNTADTFGVEPSQLKPAYEESIVGANGPAALKVQINGPRIADMCGLLKLCFESVFSRLLPSVYIFVYCKISLFGMSFLIPLLSPVILLIY